MRLINFQLIVDNFLFVLTGLPYTLGIAVASFVSGTIIGFFLARARESKHALLSLLARFYISLMRGVPMIVVLFMLYFGLPYFKIQLPALLCSYIAFSTVSAAYISEIFRSSINAVDKGQWEAARALALSDQVIIFKIILPQAFRIAVPPLGNVMLDMIKTTSLMAMVTVPDIFQNAKIVGGREFDYMSMYILVAFIYWQLCVFFEYGQTYLERHLNRYLVRD